MFELRAFSGFPWFATPKWNEIRDHLRISSKNFRARSQIAAHGAHADPKADILGSECELER